MSDLITLIDGYIPVPGAPGPPGTSFNILGQVPSVANLPPDAAQGDGYIVADTGHLWVWSGTAWVDAGPIQGPAGPAGAAGSPGPAGPAGAQGPAGVGVPAGGNSNQALTKISSADYASAWTTLTRASVGLDQVDNTSDANKPISTATATALGAKVTNGGNVSTIRSLTQAAYDAIGTKDPATLYVIVG